MRRQVRVDDVRALPVTIRPVGGETVTGYLARLAAANALPESELRLHTTELAGLTPFRPNLERAAAWVERLGSLQAGHFDRQAHTNAMYVRCHHTQWQPGSCRRCSYTQLPRTACRRCARGAPTTVRSRGGAVCNRHHRWTLDGADLDLRSHPEYAHAERCISSTLWKRGIGLQTGELQLAATLVHHWLADETDTWRVRGRMADLGVTELSGDTVFLVAYPEIVRLATVVTDLSFASYLLSPRFRRDEQVQALEAAVATIMQGHTSPRLHEIAERIVTRGKAAVDTAFSMRLNAHSKRPAALEKALVAASQRHRTCLLRHLSTVRIRAIPYAPGVAVPRNRTLIARHPISDLP